MAVLHALSAASGIQTGKKNRHRRVYFQDFRQPDAFSRCQIKSPQRHSATLYIYELTNLSQVTRVGESAFYSNIRTRLVQTVQSDASGYFSVSLPPGQYSLFTKKDALFYANNFDGQNNMAPVKVSPGKDDTGECEYGL